MIKADNYKYTKNITDELIKRFNKSVKQRIPKVDNGDFFVFKVYSGKDTWSSAKRRVAQIYDYLKDKKIKTKIIFDGDNSFQMWCFMEFHKTKKDLKKILDEKFKNSKYHNLEVVPQNKKIKVYKVNKSTGLVPIEIKRKELLNFKKKDSTMDKVNKDFKWDKKSNLDKERIAKKVREYFKFVHDQLREMHKKENVWELEDREKSNFYKQVRKKWKKYKKAQTENFLSSGRLSNLKVYDGHSTHFLKRMKERNVSPKKVIEILKDGRQLDIGVGEYLINLDKYIIPIDSKRNRLRTVDSRSKYKNFSRQKFIDELKGLGRTRRVFGASKKVILVKDLKEFESTEDLMKHLGFTYKDLVKNDLSDGEGEIVDFTKKPKDKNKDKSIMREYLKQKSEEKSAGGHLVSIPPYQGDFLDKLKKKVKKKFEK